MRNFNFQDAYYDLIAVFLIWSCLLGGSIASINAQIINQQFDSDPSWSQVNATGSVNWAYNSTGGNNGGNISLTAPAGSITVSTWYYTTVTLDPCKQYSASLDYIRSGGTGTTARIVIAIGTTVPIGTSWGTELLNTTSITSTSWATLPSTSNYFPKTEGTYYLAVRGAETSGSSSTRTMSLDNILLSDAGPSNQCRGCGCATCAASSGLFASWTAANSGSSGCTTVTRTSNGLDETFCSTWTMPASPATQNVGFFHLLTYTSTACQGNTATREVFVDPSCGSISAAGTDTDGREYWTLSANQTVRVCITRQSTGTCTSVSSPCTRPYIANVPLPVTLGRFNAVKNENINILNWTTHSEQNNEGFEVQSSSSGIDFHTIGFVKGHDNSNEEINYEFTDVKPNEKITYYRLKQIDFDGTFEYSPVIAVRSSSKGEISILNNITSHSLNLLFPDDNEAGIQIDILTANGQRVREHYVKDHKELSIDVSDLMAGIYFLRVRLEDGSIQTQRWIKQ